MVLRSPASADDQDLSLESQILADKRGEGLPERELLRRIGRIKAQVARYVSISFDQMGAAGASDTQNLLTGLQFINKEDESEVAGWEQLVARLFAEYLPSARILYARMQREFDRGRGSMSALEEAEWETFYRSPSYDYKHKENQIESILPHEIDQSIAVRLERDSLLDQAEARLIPASYALSDDSAFLRLPLSSRKAAVASFREDVRELSSELRAAHGDLRNFLSAQASGERAAFSLDEAGRWLSRAFDQAENAKDVEQFKKGTILPALARAEYLRAEYDAAEAALEPVADRLPAGFRRRSAASFLQLSVSGRAAYVVGIQNAARAASASRHAEEAEARLADDAEQSIRAALATGDWRGAQLHLETLTALDQRRDSLTGLIHAVDAAEIAGRREEDIAEARAAITRSVGTIGHTALLSAYASAVAEGVEHFDAFATLVERRAQAKNQRPVARPAPTLVRAEVMAEPVPVLEAEPAPEVSAPAADTQNDADLQQKKATERPVVAVEADDAKAVVQTVATIETVGDETAALALKAEGETISVSRQAEAAKLHPWLKHHLGVLARHGAGFLPPASRTS